MNYPTLALLLLCTLIARPVIDTPATFHYDDDLVAYYSFNQCDARDDTNNGSDGQLFGNVGCRCGIEGEGLQFDGADDYVTFKGVVNRYFNTTDFSISFYFKPKGLGVFRQSLISKREICDEYNMLDIILDKRQGIVDTDVHETPTKDYPNLSPSYPGDGWTHYVLTRKGRMAYTYINGVKQHRSVRCSGVDITNMALLSLGNSPCVGEGTRRFSGLMDELRVYDRALTEDEILSLYLRYPIDRDESDCLS